MSRIISLIAFVFTALVACSVETGEPVTNDEQALCTLPTSTRFYTLQLSTISVPEACAAAHGNDPTLPTYSPQEPRRFRVDAAAPAPRKPNGEQCRWLSEPALIPLTPACDMVRSFRCDYWMGPLLYHLILTSTPSAPGDPWAVASYQMFVQDPTGLVWGCDRTMTGPFIGD